MRPIRAGFVGFGEINTPREIIERKVAAAQSALEDAGLELVTTPPVSDDPAGKNVARAQEDLAGQEFDLLILCLAGWIPSHAVIAIADRFRHTPMILLGLTGWEEGGRFVTTADQAGTTALRKPMQDLGYTFTYIPTFRGEDLPVEVRRVVRETGCTRYHLNKLEERGLVALGTAEVWRDPLADEIFVPTTPPPLTTDQQTV